VLFLDELPEFDRKVLECCVSLWRAAASWYPGRAPAEFPAAFQLIAAMKPLPLRLSRRSFRPLPLHAGPAVERDASSGQAHAGPACNGSGGRIAEITARQGSWRQSTGTLPGTPPGARTGYHDAAALQRLTQHFQYLAIELRQFIQEQHAVVGERYLAGPREGTAAH